MVKVKESVIYGDTLKADIRGEIKVKFIEATHPAASTSMTAMVARMTRRNGITNAGIGITIEPTLDPMTMSCMSTTGAARRIGGEAGQGNDLHHDQTENIVSVTIAHTAQPETPHPLPQTAMGAIALHGE